MKSVLKKLLVISIIIMSVFLPACNSKSNESIESIAGTYLGETENKYKIVIDKDNNVKWYERSMVFEGKVKIDGDDLTFEIKGSGIFSDHVFYAEKTEDGFKMDESSIKGENFTKE